MYSLLELEKGISDKFTEIATCENHTMSHSV